jgi:hypothetical protein
MSLSGHQQQRLLYWARRLRQVAQGGEALVDREVEALDRLIAECDDIVNPPVRTMTAVHDRHGNTR